MKKLSLIFIFALLIQFNNLSAYAQAPSLYDRLGGVYTIAAVVDDFIDRLLTDPIVTANKNVVSAIQRINKPGLKFHVTEMVCEACGGPQKYAGRSMKESHAGLNISETEWAASVKDFATTLEKFKVPEKEKGELLAIVGGTKPDIVTTPVVKEEPAKVPAKVEAPKEEPLPELPGLPGLPGLPAPGL